MSTLALSITMPVWVILAVLTIGVLFYTFTRPETDPFAFGNTFALLVTLIILLVVWLAFVTVLYFTKRP